jgi:magnesium transporter
MMMMQCRQTRWACLVLDKPSGSIVPLADLGGVLQRSADALTWLHLDISQGGIPDGLRQLLKDRLPRRHVRKLLTPQYRPTLDEHEHSLFVRFLVPNPTVKPTHDEGTERFLPLQMVVCNGWLITTAAHPLPVLETVAKLASRGLSSWPTQGTTGFAAEVLDAVVDVYTEMLEQLDDHLIALEHAIMRGHRKLETRMFALQRHVLAIRHAAFQHQEVGYRLSHREMAPLSAEAQRAFERVYDHMTRVSHWCEFGRDSLTGSMTIYLGLVGNQTNEVMRFLTTITVLFMPAMLIAAIYGMNFTHMPELQWPLGYGWALGLMATSGLTLLWWFSRRKWL